MREKVYVYVCIIFVVCDCRERESEGFGGERVVEEEERGRVYLRMKGTGGQLKKWGNFDGEINYIL